MFKTRLILFILTLVCARTGICEPLEVVYNDLSTFQGISAFFAPAIDGTPQYSNSSPFQNPPFFQGALRQFPDENIPVEISSDRTSARFLAPYVNGVRSDFGFEPITGSFDFGFMGKPTVTILLSEYSVQFGLPTVALNFAGTFGPMDTTYSTHMVGSVEFGGNTIPFDKSVTGTGRVTGDFDQGYPDPLSPDLHLLFQGPVLSFSIPLGHFQQSDLSLEVSESSVDGLRVEALRLPEPSVALLLAFPTVFLAALKKGSDS